jgi:hypothetical protein
MKHAPLFTEGRVCMVARQRDVCVSVSDALFCGWGVFRDALNSFFARQLHPSLLNTLGLSMYATSPNIG